VRTKAFVLKSIFSVLFFTLFFTSFAAQTNGKNIRFERKSFFEEKFEEGKRFLHTVNSDFFRTTVCVGKEMPAMLFLQECDSREIEGEDGGVFKITVEAYLKRNEKYEFLWKICENGQSGKVHQDFFSVENYGDGTTEDNKKLFDIFTGRKLISYTGQPCEVEFTNSK